MAKGHIISYSSPLICSFWFHAPPSIFNNIVYRFIIINARKVSFQISREGQWMFISKWEELSAVGECCNQIAEGEAGAVNEKEAYFVCIGRGFIFYLILN